MFYLFYDISKKICFILFCGFCNFGKCELEKTRNIRKEEASTISADGMEGVMNEGGLDGWKMQKHVEANVEDGALALCNVNEEQVQASVEVGEASRIDLVTIEVDLQKTIDIIVEQENVVIASVLEENEHVIGHVEIDVDDIFILSYN